ncbi:hypothetical protein [Microbispora sp. NPDC046933]|uniref:hypothetical protein n=1 Tax=Microbispora sp. NPDC046933 TaxID=3155618 RepID=UPI0033D7C9C3
MKCQRHGGTVTRKIGLGLLACASVVAALAVAGPAAGATRTHGRETPRHQEPGLRPARPGGDAAQPGLTASSPTTNRGTQQITINVANGGTGIQNAMCRGNRACDIAQALGTPYAGASPVPAPAPQASPRARVAPRAGAATKAGATTRAGAAPRHPAVLPGRRGTGPQPVPNRGRAVPRPVPAPRPVPPARGPHHR